MTRRTIVVDYDGESLDVEKRYGLTWDGVREQWIGEWPQDAEIRETVEEITEHSHLPPDGVSGRTDQ